MVTVNTISVKSIISKSKIPGYDYAINPYVGCPHRCVYCYAEYMRRFTGHTEPWGQFLDVKSCPVPLKPAQLFHTHVMLSSVTDPYNPFEEKYGLTRQLLKQLAYCQAYVHIHTKSPLVLRDIDLLATMPGCEVIFSIATTDENFRQLAEPGAAPIRERLRTLQELHQRGISTAIMVAPFMPGITDWKNLLTQVQTYVEQVSFDTLNMRPAYQTKILRFIETHYPNLSDLYRDIYVHYKKDYWAQVKQEILQAASQFPCRVQLFF